ncbi:MAG: tetratricopeptide repeat protein, partial [Planctomycetota bacterium]
LELNQPDQALRLWSRMLQEFPQQAEQPRELVLSGRVHLTQDRTDEAISVFEKALAQTPDASQPLHMVARYYLIRSMFKAKKFELVVSQVSTIQEALTADERTELHGAMVMAALSSLELKQYESAISFADQYLLNAQDTRQKSDALSARSVALCRISRFPDAMSSIKTLISENPDDPQTWTTVLTSAEIAMEGNAVLEAEQFFQLAASYEKNPAVKQAGLTGIAWSQFRAKKYAEAETSFQQLAQTSPASADAPEILFMMGRSIEEQGNAERTVETYQQVFNTLTKDKPPAAEGDDEKSPGRYILDAGRQVARGLQKLKRPDEADKAWEQLVTFFPNAKELDQILDEWAWMNASESRFKRSDEIHRQLLERFPDSPFAGQARLSLAESLLDAGRIEESLREMNAIIADARYGGTEKERALFHVIQIHVTSQQWKLVEENSNLFLKSHGNSPLAPEVRLYLGDAQLQSMEPDIAEAAKKATVTLIALRDDVLSGKVASQPWVDHIWIVLAEAALAGREYEKIDQLEAELSARNQDSPEAFKLAEIQGKRWKQQAPPNFDKSREYFSVVLADVAAEGTETAARCQFQMAETYLIEKKLELAIKEYYKVVHLHDSYPAIGAEALLKAALCHAERGDRPAAVRDLTDLITKFPESAVTPLAKAELEKFGAEAK